jgi:ferredoxin-type protein NapH
VPIARSAGLFALLAGLAITLYHGALPLLTGGLAWAFLVSLLFFLAERGDKLPSYRAFFFASLAFFFLVDLHVSSASERVLQPVCHLNLAGNLAQMGYSQFLCLTSGTWMKFGIYGLGLLWLLVVLVNGGGFCSWVCFFGGWDDLFSRLLKKPLIKLPPSPRFREFQLAALVFFAAMSFLTLEPVFCKWACPFKKPTFEILNPNSPAYTLQIAAFCLVGVVFLLGCSLATKKRVFCSILCPFGALPPLFKKVSPYRITINPSSCTHCLKCQDTCPSFAIEVNNKKPFINRYCTLCLRCVANCPGQAIQPTLFHKKQSLLLPFVSVAFGGALSMFYVPQGILALAKLIGVLLS